ncbi:26S proteasome subunit P45, partial [Kipferlia bialata]
RLAVMSREEVVENYKRVVRIHRTKTEELRKLREEHAAVKTRAEQSQHGIEALQSCGQLIGELLYQVDEDKFIVSASSGTRYLVNARETIHPDALQPGSRVALDLATYTIMRVLPRKVDAAVYNMTCEEPGDVSFADVGGLGEELQQVRDVVELPLTFPELFSQVGIKPPSGLLLYGPPGTGKTLIARVLASQINASFVKVVASSIVDKYIGESARVIREMFVYARQHQPCIVFIDEIDAIGGTRFKQGSSADREIQRTLMQLLAELDGFSGLERVKVVMATNRPDILDPALLRPGRLDRKVEIGLPNEQGRFEVMKIH